MPVEYFLQVIEPSDIERRPVGDFLTSVKNPPHEGVQSAFQILIEHLVDGVGVVTTRSYLTGKVDDFIFRSPTAQKRIKLFKYGHI